MQSRTQRGGAQAVREARTSEIHVATSDGSQCAREIDRQPEKAKAAQDEQAGWEAEVAKLKALLPAEVALKQIADVEIPDAVKAARAFDDKLPELTSAADTVRCYTCSYTADVCRRLRGPAS